MSRFFSQRHRQLKAYVPGEQPKDQQYIKLNTNESPYPPSEAVVRAAEAEAGRLQLYSDPECRDLNREAAEYFGVTTDMLLMTNGSDEILNFAFAAFGDEEHPFAYPALSYGFYPVFGQINRIPCKAIPLKEDFTIDVEDYVNLGCNIVIANPNAPTGLLLTVEEIRRIVSTNPDHVVVIDEAYIDFGGETALPMIREYDNLLVTRTFSKSYSLAGARLGFGMGDPALIRDLNTIKYSTNPYNVNRMTMAAGAAALRDGDYYLNNCKKIMDCREKTAERLKKLGFSMTDSKANFLFVTHPELDGEKLYLRLKEMGILIRHFDNPDICQYNRITVGTPEQMDALVSAIETIQKEGLQ